LLRNRNFLKPNLDCAHFAGYSVDHHAWRKFGMLVGILTSLAVLFGEAMMVGVMLLHRQRPV
jgi:hypothetical protein